MGAYTIGLIVNPIAGMGGSVGLKGTDGALRDDAVARGAQPSAAQRVVTGLRALAMASSPAIRILTAQGEMGADAVDAAGLEAEIVYTPAERRTSAKDTKLAAKVLADRGVDLLVFAGGDGTARDVLEAVGDRVPALGMPCGVKMHSAVFAATPRSAANAIRAFGELAEPGSVLCKREVMDRCVTDGSEASSPDLYGFLQVPRIPDTIVAAKSGGGTDALLRGACRRIAEIASDERVTLLGPGTTLQTVKAELGFDGTLLGVDAVRDGCLIGKDLGEAEILHLIRGNSARIVVGIVGGQGFLFGRGNQQLSARVIRTVGIDNIVVVASAGKLTELSAGLLVDTGDAELDRELCGYVPVQVADRRTMLARVRDAGSEGDFVRTA